MRNRSRFICLYAAVTAVTLGGSTGVKADNLIWDANGTTAPLGQDGSGSWDTTNPNWVSGGLISGTNVTWSNANPDSASFGNSTNVFVGAATPNNVDLGAPITAQDITLGVAADGSIYNISDFGGGSLTLNGNVTKTAAGGALSFLLTNGLTLGAGDHTFVLQDTPGDAAELSINGAISGGGNVVLDNGAGLPSWGTLVFNTNNTYTGNTTITKGRLVTTATGALGTGTITIGTTGTLSIGGAGTASPGVTLSQPITITRNTYTGGDLGNYPYALITQNGTGTSSISGTFVIDSTDARISVNTSTLNISSNIAQGPNVTTGSISFTGDFAGFVNLTGDNSALAAGGFKIMGGVEVIAASELNLAGATAPLSLLGGTIHPTGALATSAFMTNFGTHVINNGTGPTVLGTLNGGVNVESGATFNASGLYGVALGKRGTGTMNFSGTNVFSGIPFYDAGIVNFSDSTTYGAFRIRSATFNINDGATVTTTNSYTDIGSDSPDSGIVNVLGTGKLVLANQDFNVSDNTGTTGVLNIQDTATVTAAGNSFFGKTLNSTGTVNLSGTTGAFTATGSINIGAGTSGTGFFNVSGGTLTANGQFFIGGATKGVGTLTISGTGTVLAKKTGQQSFAIGGGSTGAGTVTMSAGTLTVTGETWVGNNTGSTGTYTQTGGTATVNDWVAVGRGGATGTFDISGGTFTRAGTATGNNNYVGESANQLSVMTVHGTGSVSINTGQFWLGNAGSSKGTLNIADTGSFTVTNNWLAVARNGTSQGVINISGGTLTKTGTYNLVANTGTSFTIGSGGTAVGIVNQTGGTLNSDATFVGENGTGTMTVSAGTANLNNFVTIGTSSAGNGTLTISGTGNVVAGSVIFGNANTSTGVLNLNGGTLTAASIGAGASTAAKTFNFNGGTLKPSADTTTFMQGLTTASVKNGGAIIDSNAHTITIAQALVTGGTGGLTKNGLGTLALSAVNTYTGNTTVNAGTLTINTGGSIASNTNTVASGATMNVDGSLPTTATVNDNGTVNFGGNTGATPLIRQIAALNVGAAAVAKVLTSATPNIPTVLDPTLTFGAAGTLDLTNNELIVNSATPATVRGLLQAGSIFTSNPGAVANGTLGYIDAGGGNTEVRFTLLGDSDLNGKVDVNDLGNLASNYGATTGAIWVQGDFDYNGTVDVSDLGDLAGSYGSDIGGGYSAGAPALAAALAVAASPAVSGAAVPEPTSLGLLGATAIGLLSQRKRKRK